MDDKLLDSTLLNIAISVAFIGLLLLFAYMYFNPIPTKNIQSLNYSDLNKNIKISGTVRDIVFGNKSITIKLAQECIMNVITFDDIELSNNTRIIVQGRFQDPDKKFLIADNVKVIK